MDGQDFVEDLENQWRALDDEARELERLLKGLQQAQDVLARAVDLYGGDLLVVEPPPPDPGVVLDQAFNVLSAIEAPTSVDALVQLVALTNVGAHQQDALRDIASLLGSDARFQRAGDRHWGLAGWPRAQLSSVPTAGLRSAEDVLEKAHPPSPIFPGLRRTSKT